MSHSDHRNLVYPAAAPVWLQKAMFAVLAKIGRRLGREGSRPSRPVPEAAG